MLFRRVGIHTTGGLARRLGAAVPGALVGGTLLLLGLPVVADLLVTVFERGVGDAVRALFALVLLHRGIVYLGEYSLRVLIGFPYGAGQFGEFRVTAPSGLGHRLFPSSTDNCSGRRTGGPCRRTTRTAPA